MAYWPLCMRYGVLCMLHAVVLEVCRHHRLCGSHAAPDRGKAGPPPMVDSPVLSALEHQRSAL